MESCADEDTSLLEKYGVTDEESGHERAKEAREYLLQVARSVMREGDFTIDHLIVGGMVARAQAFHEAALEAINSNNPHAAFTLLRAYIEQSAAALYLTDHPSKAERLWNDLEGRGVPIGRITGHADRSGRFKNFRQVYDQLSKYAHPSSISHFANMRVGEGNEFTFQTAPRFKSDDEKLTAYAWLIEFAYVTHVCLFEFAQSKGMGKIVRDE